MNKPHLTKEGCGGTNVDFGSIELVSIAEAAGRLKGFFEVFQKCSPDAPQSMTS